MTASHYHAHSWGGVQADAHAGGAASTRALAPSTAQLVQAQWDDTEIPDERYCKATSKRTNCQCRAYPMVGENYCTFHMKSIDQENAGDGAVA